MITLIIGPMYSGKTSMMLHLLERAYIAKKRVLLIRPEIDNRGFLSHSNKDTSWLEEQIFDLYYPPNLQDYDSIGIDEGQFQSSLKSFCLNHTDKHIIVSALHATSECEMFQPIIDIIPYCENIVKLNAICTQCNSEYGNYTFYLGAQKNDKIVVGGKDIYTVLCNQCYSKVRKTC
jgi:thymidine kinase